MWVLRPYNINQRIPHIHEQATIEYVTMLKPGVKYRNSQTMRFNIAGVSHSTHALKYLPLSLSFHSNPNAYV